MGLPSSARLRRAVPAPTGRTGQRSGRACTPRRHENAVSWTLPVSAPRHHAERRAGKGTPTSGRHSPPKAGGGKDPELGGFASRPGPRRSASSGWLRGTRLSLRSAQRCRAPPGEPARGRAGPAHPAGMKMQFPGRCQSRPHATMQSDAQARERRPPVGTARRRRAAGRTPSSGGFASRPGPRRSASSGWLRGTRLSLRSAQRCRAPPGEPARGRAGPAHPAGMKMQFPGRCQSRPHATMQSDAQARERRPPVGTARRRRAAGRTPSSGGFPVGTRCSALCGRWGSTPFAALRAAVPTGGRRSLADGAIWTVGVSARGCIFTAIGRS